jgi:hypothetical protein
MLPLAGAVHILRPRSIRCSWHITVSLGVGVSVSPDRPHQAGERER